MVSLMTPLRRPHRTPRPQRGARPTGRRAWGLCARLAVWIGRALAGARDVSGFTEAWPPRTGDLADRINALPKYVASRTLEEPLEWNATLLEVDLAAEVFELKAKAGQNILKYGTGELTISLMKHNLIDEFHSGTFPSRLEEASASSRGWTPPHLELVDTTTFKSGIVGLRLRSQVEAPSSTPCETQRLGQVQEFEAGLAGPQRGLDPVVWSRTGG
jgi:dihydrofolate reductase